MRKNSAERYLPEHYSWFLHQTIILILFDKFTYQIDDQSDVKMCKKIPLA